MKKHKQITKLFIKSNIKSAKAWPKYKPSATYKWIVTESGIPWLKLNITIPFQNILDEIVQSNHLLVNHRDDYGEHEGWQSFCIHGKSLTETKHCSDDRPYTWIPEVKQLMPKTVKFFQDLNLGNYLRLRVMALQPGGYISLHKDSGHNQTLDNFLSPINIAITQPKDCYFVMKDWGTVPFNQGDALMLDVNNYHAVLNNSNQTRYHLIVHTENRTDFFKNLVVDSYNKYLL